MKKLVVPIADFELTTSTIIKYFKDVSINILYEIVNESFDGKPYKDLILYIPSGEIKNMCSISDAREKVIEEITNYPGSFMSDFSNYQIYSKEFESRTVFCIRKYNHDTKIY